MKKIDKMTKVYQMIKKLKSSRKINFKRFIKLIIRFYIFHFTNYKSVTDFSGQF